MLRQCQYETGETVPLWGESIPLTLTLGRSSVHHGKEGLLLSAPKNADRETKARILDVFYREQLHKAISEQWESCMLKSETEAHEWRIRNMKTRWGSCNVAKKRIWINLRLAEKPPECLHYIILHELCHLHEREHGRAFWERMDACCPDWRAIRKRLNGQNIPCT